MTLKIYLRLCVSEFYVRVCNRVSDCQFIFACFSVCLLAYASTDIAEVSACAFDCLYGFLCVYVS